MHSLKQFLDLLFESLILGSLVELANKMSARTECIAGKLQSSSAKVLKGVRRRLALSKLNLFRVTSTHHASRVVTKCHAARIHQPMIGITQSVRVEAGGLLPGC